MGNNHKKKDAAEQGETPPQVLEAAEAIRQVALGYPETHEDHPWGESAFKVKKKSFIFMSVGASGLGFTVKLPESGDFALSLPFVQPTGYGLGRSGWVSAKFGPEVDPPLEMLCEWLDESYRAVAPKALVKQL